MLTVGDILVPLIFQSDRTHMLNVACDKKEWPVYMTIGNLWSKIRQPSSTQCVMLVALLLIPITNRNIPPKRVDEQRRTNREVLNEVLPQGFQLLTFKQHPSSESGYYNVLYADGNFRHWKPALSAWLADGPDYSDLHHLDRHVRFWCDCPKKELGGYVHPAKQHPRRDNNLYRTLRDGNTKVADAQVSSRHVHRGFIVFRHNTCIVNDLSNPDLVHTMQIGMLDHLQKSSFYYMKTQERLDKYNAIWLFVSAYHQRKLQNESYEEVSQCNGKEMKEMSRYLLGVVTQSL
jgi:hypothetical protein